VLLCWASGGLLGPDWVVSAGVRLSSWWIRNGFQGRGSNSIQRPGKENREVWAMWIATMKTWILISVASCVLSVAYPGRKRPSSKDLELGWCWRFEAPQCARYATSWRKASPGGDPAALTYDLNPGLIDN